MTNIWVDEDSSKVTITCEVQRETGVIYLSDSINKNMKNIMDTKEVAVRHALIKLGWTPPAEQPAKELNDATA